MVTDSKKSTPPNIPKPANDDMLSDQFLTPKIWKSRLGWKITLSVFFTILLVEMGIFYFTAQDYKASILENMSESARVTIASVLKPITADIAAPIITAPDAQNIFNTTMLRGISIYNLDGSQAESYGELVQLSLSSPIQRDDYLSKSWDVYEKVLTSADLGKPYHVVVRLDAKRLKPFMVDYITHNALIVLLLSAFVTSVLMIVLGRWLLEPIITLRNNLLSVSKDPESPEKYVTSFDTNDEIGVVVRAANELIYQNAQNLKRLKSQAQDTIHQLAYYDALTGLPNRTLFLQELDKGIDTLKGKETHQLVVAVVDLDHFKDINDTMGHNVGDQLLSSVGARLRDKIADKGYVARSGEDEFAVTAILERADSIEKTIAKMVFDVFERPFKAGGEEFQIRSSIGISCFPQDGSEGVKLLKSADIALNRAKQEGRDTVRYYTADFDRDVRERFEMIRDLRSALELNQLRLLYQPQFNLKTGKVIGAEALIRWWRPDESHPDGGVMVPPLDFIPLAEQTGLIVPIGKWVLEEACYQNKKWQEMGLGEFRVAVNISAIQFQQANLTKDVERVLERTGLEAKWLELEVTESVFMDDIHKTIHTLETLNDIGVELAIDDFGTGYSSLSYLRQFPIDRLKIDQSFIRNALENDDDAAITKTIVKLGQALGVKVIAEGVETKEHEAFLKAQDCDEVQGYLYSAPVSIADFETYVKTRKNKEEEKTKE